MKLVICATAAMGLTVCAVPPMAMAQDAGMPSNQNVFVLGGPFTNGYFGNAFRFWENHYETNFFAGVGYQYFLWEDDGGFKLGAEAGVGLRLGPRASAEAWAGVVGRFDVFEVGDVNITPSLTFGLSAVTDTIGVETERAAAAGYDSLPVFFYMGPEIAVSHDAYPDLELLARVHHRSGGFGTIAPVDGSNAAVLGLRYKF